MNFHEIWSICRPDQRKVNGILNYWEYIPDISKIASLPDDQQQIAI